MAKTVKKKIGLLVVATGKYGAFFNVFYWSVWQYFMLDHDLTTYLFTDAPDDYKGYPGRLRRIGQDHYAWPGATLYRYRMFLRRAKILQREDYLFYLDVDSVLVDQVGSEILPAGRGCLAATMHPACILFENLQNPFQAFETNPASAAYIPKGLKYPLPYCAGGFNGGKTWAFLRMAQDVDAMIRRDEAHGLRAKHNDESYLNRYLLNNWQKVHLLSPAYTHSGRPQLYHVEPKIMVLGKDHDKMRQIKKKNRKREEKRRRKDVRF